MGNKRDLSPTTIGRIIGLLSLPNYTQRKIANIVGVSQRSVYKINMKLKNGEPTKSKRLGACGKTRATTIVEDEAVVEICMQNRKLPLRGLVQKIAESNITISQRTLRRRLKESGLMARRPTKKPRLTPAMVAKRLRFAEKYKSFTQDDWNRVII